MRIVLNPDNHRPSALRVAYDLAFKEATELYIASAYLTEWSASKPLGSACRRVLFVVGTDFGLSRKKAMFEVLRWIPKGTSFLFKAVPRNQLPGGFHPKVIFWKTKNGRHYCVLGSSNLSKAAFSDNYEANVLVRISKTQFDQLASWLSAVPSTPISGDWIRHKYKEASLPTLEKLGGARKLSAHFVFRSGLRYAKRVQERRQQQAVFKKLASKIRSQLRLCATRKLSDRDFWAWFWQSWSNRAKNWRFQGKGLEISGKTAKWHEACRALMVILESAHAAREDELDHVVSEQLDRLARLHNPARGAWFTEMLCHFFPDRYPLRNAPVQRWLKQNRYRGTRGLTSGQRYVELAGQLRAALTLYPGGARNLAELDTVIWLQGTK